MKILLLFWYFLTVFSLFLYAENMHWLLILLQFTSGVFCAKKLVKIVQEPANYRGLNDYQSNNPMTPKPTLKASRKQEAFSGPYHLKKLYGKCFSLNDNIYKYELCPFFNITQHEQTWRWNAFQGILGIWKEWSIINNTFEAMVMTDGGQCPGEMRRESKVFLNCGKRNVLVSVKEPYTCRYDVIFQTPLACPVDAFLVYPALSVTAQKEWQEIEESLYHEELTMQGYKKRRHHLFVRAGLLASPRHDAMVTGDVKGAVSENEPKRNLLVPKTKFDTKQECLQAYSELLHEFLKLRQLLEKHNSSEISHHVSQISTVVIPTSDMLRVRGDTGLNNYEPTTHVGPSAGDKKQPFLKFTTPASSRDEQIVVVKPNKTTQTQKYNNNMNRT